MYAQRLNATDKGAKENTTLCSKSFKNKFSNKIFIRAARGRENVHSVIQIAFLKGRHTEVRYYEYTLMGG